jgi:ATP-dependent Clp protease protease subunit
VKWINAARANKTVGDPRTGVNISGYPAADPISTTMTELENHDAVGHTQALADHGIMVLMGEVNEENVKPVIEWILHENFVRKKKKKELLLMINSDGGNLSDAFALIDVMNTSAIPVKTVGLGVIASAGLCIFISGAPGRRVLTPNTSILSHQFSWHNSGKAHELFATVKEFELTHQRMVKLYQRCTGLDDSAIQKVLLPAQDVYLTAEEALQYHICDAVSDAGAPAPRARA